MNAARTKGPRPLSVEDLARLQRAGNKAIRKFNRAMPADQREDHVQSAIAEAIEQFPDGTVDELEAHVTRRAASIAGAAVKLKKRHDAIEEQNPGLQPASSGESYSGEELRRVVADTAWRELSKSHPWLTREGLESVTAERAELVDSPSYDEREEEAWWIFRKLARVLVEASVFCHSLRSQPAEGEHPQIERLSRVVRELCGDVRFSDLVQVPIGDGYAEIVHSKDGQLRPMCDSPTAQELLAYTDEGDRNMPVAPFQGTRRAQICFRWLMADWGSPDGTTNRTLALVSLLAGQWPSSVDEPAMVQDVIALEEGAIKKTRQREDLTSRRMRDLAEMAQEAQDELEAEAKLERK